MSSDAVTMHSVTGDIACDNNGTILLIIPAARHSLPRETGGNKIDSDLR